jgi:hypothetical protein
MTSPETRRGDDNPTKSLGARRLVPLGSGSSQVSPVISVACRPVGSGGSHSTAPIVFRLMTGVATCAE